jgi:RNA polymerase sigma factor (sigma-70 family)
MSDARMSRDGSGLVERIRRGEPAAEEQFARMFGGPLRAMMLSRTKHHEDAEDLAQDTLVALLRALRRGTVASEERLSAFVHGTARNIANNHFRARDRRPCELPLNDDLPANPVGSALETEDRLALALEALVRQSASDRRILELSLVEHLRPLEIAQVLHVRPELVRAHKSRAAHRWLDALDVSDRATRRRLRHAVTPRVAPAAPRANREGDCEPEGDRGERPGDRLGPNGGNPGQDEQRDRRATHHPPVVL